MYKVLTCPKCKTTFGAVVCETSPSDTEQDLFECGKCLFLFRFDQSQAAAEHMSTVAGVSGVSLLSDHEVEALSLHVVVPVRPKRAETIEALPPPPKPILKAIASFFTSRRPRSDAELKGEGLELPAPPPAALLVEPGDQSQQDVRLIEPTSVEPVLDGSSSGAIESAKLERSESPQILEPAVETKAISEKDKSHLPVSAEPELVEVTPIAAPSEMMLEVPSFMTFNSSPHSGKWKASTFLLGTLLVVTAVYAVWADSRRLAAKPALTNLMAAFCQAAGCDVRPLLNMEPMVITTSSFTEGEPGKYSFGFSLMNSSPDNLAIPNVQIYFVDSKERTVMTRLVQANQIVPGRNVLLGGQTVAVLFDLTLPDAVRPLVAGYKLAVVNPDGLPAGN